MKIQTQILAISFVLLSLTRCKPNKEYMDYCAPLRTDYIQKITIEIQSDSIITYTITNKQDMTEFITDLNNSKVNGAWKGAKWDKIILHYDDSEKVFSTNGEVFGDGSSGTFYDLNKKYEHYWKKQPNKVY